MTEQRRKAYLHLVRERYCKGCGICVAYCPKKVLALKNGKLFIERPELCVGCRMCELRCPDYAIEIHEAGDEAEAGANGADLDYEAPPEALDE